MEGWVDVMYMVQDGYSFWVWVYFITLIIVGGLITMNLFLVVIATQFGSIKQQEVCCISIAHCWITEWMQMKQMEEERQAELLNTPPDLWSDLGVCERFKFYFARSIVV